jgi:hypothetical protein
MLFVGIFGEYTTKAKTRMIFYCLHESAGKIHGFNRIPPAIKTFLNNGNGCYDCGHVIAAEKRRNSNGGLSKHISTIMETGRFKNGTIFKKSDRKNKKGSYAYLNMICPDCSVDEYVSAGVCTGVFVAAMAHLKNGKIPCRCNPSYRWTQPQREYQIKNELLRRSTDDLEFIFSHWENAYINVESRFFYYRTDKLEIQHISVDNFNQSKGCSLYQHGFNTELPTRLYMHTDHHSYSDKTGITQRDNDIRLYEINTSFKREFNYDNWWDNIFCVYFFNTRGGYLARDLERLVHTAVECGKPNGNMGLYTKGDGCTETYEIYKREIAVNVINEYLSEHEGEYIIEKDILGLFGEVIV